MKSVASFVLPVVGMLAVYGPPAFADSAPSATEPQSAGTMSLPAFVPPTGQEKYASALHSSRGQGTAARQEAEKISALFAGMTTGSISKRDDVAQAEPDPAKPVQPPLPEAQAGRSIMLASNQSQDDTTEKGSAPAKETSPATRAKGNGTTHRIPQRALAKATRSSHDAEHEGPDTTTSTMTLAAVGQKVSVIDLLTNPALWWHK